MIDELEPIAAKYGADKTGAHFYTQHYHRHFNEIRDKPIRLLEIGIGGYEDPNRGGNSLRMWRDYFPKGIISGLDISPKRGIAEDRIKVYQGSQADPVTIANILNDTEGREFDIIVDDGSHRSEHIIASFYMLFPCLSADGWYAIEDTSTSYWSNYGGANGGAGYPQTTMSFFKDLIDGLNWQEIHRPHYVPSYFDQKIVGIHFYHNLILIKKGHNWEGSTYVKDNIVPYQSGILEKRD